MGDAFFALFLINNVDIVLTDVAEGLNTFNLLIINFKFPLFIFVGCKGINKLEELP